MAGNRSDMEIRELFTLPAEEEKIKSKQYCFVCGLHDVGNCMKVVPVAG